MAEYVSINLEIPDKQPFEGKATQKQKQKIWELGFEEEKVIEGLGKKQASYIIDALLKTHDTVAVKQDAKFIMSISLAVSLFSLIGLIFVSSTGMQIVLVIIAGITLTKFLVSAAHYGVSVFKLK